MRASILKLVQALVAQLGMNFLEHLVESSDADVEVMAMLPKEVRNWVAAATFCARGIRYVEPIRSVDVRYRTPLIRHLVHAISSIPPATR